MFVVIVVCGVLLAIGVVLAIMWSGERLTVPAFARGSPTRHRDGLRYYVWWASILVAIAAVSSVLITGAGGRVAMRLLASGYKLRH